MLYNAFHHRELLDITGGVGKYVKKALMRVGNFMAGKTTVFILFISDMLSKQPRVGLSTSYA